jgi:hypothetical protein
LKKIDTVPSGSQHIVSHTFVYNLFNWLNINMWIQKPTENLRYKYGSLPVMTNIDETMHFKSYISNHVENKIEIC